MSEGEARAKSNAANRILNASKITSVASMIQQIKTAAGEDPSCYAYDASNSRPDAQLVPKKTLVEFQVCSSNPRGEILGLFEFNGIKYCGKLVNVNAKNRDFYCSTKRKMKVAVGKYNGKEYILSEA